MGVFLRSIGPNLMRFNLGRTEKYGFSGQFFFASRFSGAMQIKRSSHLFSVHFPALPASVVTLASICSDDARSIYSAAKVLFHESMLQLMSIVDCMLKNTKIQS
ncbi:hypothetical protein Peur_036022 [Populus x canadensis]